MHRRLTDFLQNEEPDLVIITEHGLSQDNLQNTCIEGYTFIGSIASKKNVKRGVAEYAKKDMEHHVKLIYTSGNETELICETALFEIKLTRQTILVLGVYRPSSANLEQAIDILTEQLNRALEIQDKPIVLIGDVNVDNPIKENASEKIVDFLTTLKIIRMSLPPTKDTEKSIDWICTNIDPQLMETSVILSGLSDQAENKSKALWQAINSERKAKSNTDTKLYLKIDDNTIHDPVKIANDFNNFFATIAERTLHNNNTSENGTLQNMPPKIDHNLQFTPATEDEVLKL
ncbi:hypothetical protein J6590_009897 [Homalodisca vitripennis]|nr:hypothetical protein J6590_009897 [Homalodisca vitripennis]